MLKLFKFFPFMGITIVKTCRKKGIKTTFVLIIPKKWSVGGQWEVHWAV